MPIDYVEHLRREGAATVAAARRGPLTASVTSCPGWDLGELVRHVAGIHRWATLIAITGQRPDERPQTPDGDAAVDFLAAGIEPLAAALAALDPDAPCWNFTGANQTGSFWPRRQAHETAIHRWDAQSSIGTQAPIDATLAADGIDELLTMFQPARAKRATAPILPGSLHVHCTDVPGEWTIHPDGNGLSVTRQHGKGDAALRGPASTLLLALWHRLPMADNNDVECFGDRAVLDAWAAFGSP